MGVIKQTKKMMVKNSCLKSFQKMQAFTRVGAMVKHAHPRNTGNFLLCPVRNYTTLEKSGKLGSMNESLTSL